MPNREAAIFDVLLVEDEPDDASLVRLALKTGGVACRLLHAADGVEALALLRDADVARPNLILLDINMPRMNGLELLRKLKADDALASIPVVMLTVSDAEQDIAASYEFGASGYITKPMDIEHFILTIRQVEDYWFGLSRLPERE